MKIAATIQRALFPASQRKGEGYELAATSLPCRAIGGDFFDYFDGADARLGFVLGDVAGKGPPAALLASRLQGMMAAFANGSRGPAHTATLVNGELARRVVEGRFATVFHGLLAPDGRLTYTNAGHNPPLIVGPAGVRRLETGGLPLGLFDSAAFDEETVQLDRGDLMIVFSDGVVEATDGDGVEFGEERLVDRTNDLYSNHAMRLVGSA